MFKFQRYGYRHTELKNRAVKSFGRYPRKDLKPGDAEYKKLRRSIEEFVYIEPVMWNNQTGNIMGGHQRLKAGLNKKISVNSFHLIL